MVVFLIIGYSNSKKLESTTEMEVEFQPSQVVAMGYSLELKDQVVEWDHSHCAFLRNHWTIAICNVNVEMD